MTGYYDIVLGLIPLSLFGVSGVLTVLGVEATLAVTVAATIAVTFMGHAMFVRAPTGRAPVDRSAQRRATQRSTHVETNPVNSD